MTPLDKSIRDLAERHNLLAVSVVLHRYETGGDSFHGSAQWADDSKKHGRGIATFDAPSFTEALSGAISAMLAERGKSVEIPTDALELAA